jgi:hypothetical protein
MIRCFGVAVLSLAIACGGGKGGGTAPPGDNTPLSSLDAGELAAECAILIDLFPQRMVVCDGQTVTIGSNDVSSCTGSAPRDPACPVTRGEAEACFEAFGDLSDAAVCAGELPSECDGLMAAGCSRPIDARRSGQPSVVRRERGGIR